MLKQDLTNDTTALGGLPIAVLAIVIAFVADQINLFWELVFGLILSYAVTILIRLAYFKVRPIKQKFRTIFGKVDASSFPSLHSLRSTVYAIILMNFFQNVWLTILLALAVAGVATTRLMLKRHYLVDVIWGVVIGLVVGLAIVILGVPDLSQLLS